MDNVIESAFEKMCKTYVSLLSIFYPARGATGFTEQNLVHNFINALKDSLEDDSSVHWLEFPWANKSKHIDGMVFSPKYKTIFYIEAKRFSISRQKASIINDIKRVVVEDRTFINKNNIFAEHEYIIALSDVWLENRWKTAIPRWWTGLHESPSQLIEWENKPNNCLAEPKSSLEIDLKQREVDWSGYNSYVYLVGDKAENYCLLLASKKI